jgi:transposase
MKTKTHFAFRVDIWDDTGDSIVEHVAGVDDFEVAVLVEPLLVVRQVLREQVGILHRRLLAIVRDDDVCRRLMTVPGVGPVVALTYRTTVDVPAPSQWYGI